MNKKNKPPQNNKKRTKQINNINEVYSIDNSALEVKEPPYKENTIDNNTITHKKNTNNSKTKNSLKRDKTLSHKKTKALQKNTGAVHGEDLSDLHKLIIDEYHINGYNKSKAVKTFKPDIKSLSAAVHVFNAIANTSKAKKYITSIQARLRSSNHISREQTLNEFTSWSFADATDFIGLSPDEVKQLPPQTRRCIQSYKVIERTETNRAGEPVTTKTIDLKLVNKLDALKEATKIIGGYEIDNKQKSKTLDVSSLNTNDQLELLRILTKKPKQDNIIDVTP